MNGMELWFYASRGVARGCTKSFYFVEEILARKLLILIIFI